MSNAGRQTHCTEETIELICKNISTGLSQKDSCIASNVSTRAFYNWLAWGKEELERVSENNRRKVRSEKRNYVQLVQSVKKAHSLRKRTLLIGIKKAAIGGSEHQETRETFDAAGKSTGKIVTTKSAAPQWQADAWLLERLHFNEFGKRSQIAVSYEKEIKKTLEDSGLDETSVEALESRFVGLLEGDTELIEFLQSQADSKSED